MRRDETGIISSAFEKMSVRRSCSFSSMLMQNSKVKGLPGVSSEDLRDRLSEDEAESVRRWGKTPKGQNTIAIVKKIPFAVFIAMGYLTYLVVWSVIR